MWVSVEKFKLIKMQMSGVGPVRFGPGSDRSGPVQDRLQTSPVLGLRFAKFSVLGPASLVRSWTDEHPYLGD